MEQSWRLSFRDFGKIKSGSVEIAPLMLFVGDNNSGKSYVMTLLWGVLTEARKLFPNDPPSSKVYKEVDQYLVHIMGKKTSITNEEAQVFVDWFNDLLKQKKKELTNRVFQRRLDIGYLAITNFKRTKPLEIKFEEKRNGEMFRYSSGKHYIRIPYSERSQNLASERYKIAKYVTWKLLMDQLSSPLYPTGDSTASNTRAIGEALYLPASRTGFMLTYKTLVQDMMEMAIHEKQDDPRLQFTLPVYRFLQGLLKLDESTKSKYEDIGEFIEREILKGEMKQQNGVIPTFYYQPHEQERPMPLYLTSSLVTELSPLILFLKSKTTYKSLFFEEAEAHLHPRVQRILAIALVKLVNRGIPVWLTTHSDILFQQINNVMKLAKHPNRQELMDRYGYVEEDVLNSSHVRAYQFKRTEVKTIIEELEVTDNGFPAETFNQVIFDLNEETYDLQIGDDDEES
ncbi:hypothetical protein JCM9140_4387 [Halalkalibacter wakoensis JCM 9140]|uniref:Endonuclease GajA/Old nuclease/RecF-like AAA domain-containing protein n=1 Tax=Halalkalibacter wakoensis JCM 9140 TaxID=1236970 RepID=W4Q878_9BACI|nr:AAA family ATPase [Halalkalibacter wakoensis]GAE28180.1 hypothetical protein JCM9140_4387 [Halalkalibacter wakoensis JCM 9140]